MTLANGSIDIHFPPYPGGGLRRDVVRVQRRPERHQRRGGEPHHPAPQFSEQVVVQCRRRRWKTGGPAQLH